LTDKKADHAAAREEREEDMLSSLAMVALLAAAPRSAPEDEMPTAAPVFEEADATSLLTTAGKAVYVDDTPANNGTIPCPVKAGAPNPTTIEDGIAALGGAKTNVTVYVCPGQYTAPATGYYFASYTNLRIIGLGSPVISAPPAFFGYLFLLQRSLNVAVRGLVLDGRGDVAAGVAINFIETTGLIQLNTVRAWHQKFTLPLPFVETAASIGIAVGGTPPAPATGIAQVVNNSLYDVGDLGILVNSPKARVAGNRVVFSSAIIPAYVYYPNASVHSTPIQAGIHVLFYGRGSVVTGNQVLSTNDLFPKNYYSRGIMLAGVSGVRVVANTVQGTAYQISIEEFCERPADGNFIYANKLYDTSIVGVYVASSAIDAASCTAQDFHADDNQITYNTIYALAGPDVSGLYAVYLSATGGGRINDVKVTRNTFAGFPETALSGPLHVVDPAATPGAVTDPNTRLKVPPPAPLR
jgi:hypothetical protein